MTRSCGKRHFSLTSRNVFFEEYNARYPDSWSAVSWEYAAILDIWHAAVEKAGTVSPVSVLAAMKQLGHVTHAFGPAEWWGSEIFGIDNALVGDWPVVEVQDGKACVVGFGSVPAWLARHSDLLREEMQNLGQMWQQRLERAETGTELPGTQPIAAGWCQIEWLRPRPRLGDCGRKEKSEFLQQQFLFFNQMQFDEFNG